MLRSQTVGRSLGQGRCGWKSGAGEDSFVQRPDCGEVTFPAAGHCDARQLGWRAMLEPLSRSLHRGPACREVSGLRRGKLLAPSVRLSSAALGGGTGTTQGGTLAVAGSFAFGRFLFPLEPAAIFQFPSSSSAKLPLTFPETDPRRQGMCLHSPHLPGITLPLELPFVQNSEHQEVHGTQLCMRIFESGSPY